MSGRRRLAVFLTAVWLALWWVMVALDPYPNWTGFVALGVLPAAFAWGAWWVWSGYRRA